MMGMTIDESIRILVDRYIDTYVVCGGENNNPAINITRQDYRAFHVAVDTMRKYQKVEAYMRKLEKSAQYGTLRKLKIALGEIEDE